MVEEAMEVVGPEAVARVAVVMAVATPEGATAEGG